MQRKYIGDSYDLVKRFLSESLREIAPLYAHQRFVPLEIRPEYTRITSIPILEEPPSNPFAILLDPDVGIPFPSSASEHPTASHAPLPFLVKVNACFHPKYIICFDQSYHRTHELRREVQRSEKRKFLQERNLFSFYFVSHAPFLFTAENPKILEAIRVRLVSLGIPESRFEPGTVE